MGKKHRAKFKIDFRFFLDKNLNLLTGPKGKERQPTKAQHGVYLLKILQNFVV